MIDDPEIHRLLKQIQTKDADAQRNAWRELHRFRAEALAAVRSGEDTIERELQVALVRGRLRDRLQELLQS